jgi:hypothetical protein
MLESIGCVITAICLILAPIIVLAFFSDIWRTHFRGAFRRPTKISHKAFLAQQQKAEKSLDATETAPKIMTIDAARKAFEASNISAQREAGQKALDALDAVEEALDALDEAPSIPAQLEAVQKAIDTIQRALKLQEEAKQKGVFKEKEIPNLSSQLDALEKLEGWEKKLKALKEEEA